MADFYLRYYVGHKGKFGHEFLEFEFRPDGKLRYANNSNYKNDTMIRKEVFVSKSVMQELKRVIDDSEILQEDDSLWPQPDRVGRQVRRHHAPKDHPHPIPTYNHHRNTPILPKTTDFSPSFSLQRVSPVCVLSTTVPVTISPNIPQYPTSKALTTHTYLSLSPMFPTYPPLPPITLVNPSLSYPIPSRPVTTLGPQLSPAIPLTRANLLSPIMPDNPHLLVSTVSPSYVTASWVGHQAFQQGFVSGSN